MAIPRLYIDEKKKKKDGFVSIYCMVHIESKTIKINTNVSVLYERFDVVKGRIKGNTKEDNDNNLIIDRCLSLINEIFVRYRLQNRILTADLLLREYKKPSMYIDFYNFFDKKINERIRAKEIGAESGKHHRVLLNKLKEFKPVLSFAEIDLKFLVSFRNFCRITKGNSVNTNQKTFAYFSCYLNIAKREEIISNNPLELLEFKRIDVHMSFLTEVELKKLVKYYDREEFQENLHKILRHFLFCCLTGIRRSDFKRLEKKHVQESTLKFIPHKTRNQKAKELHIPLIDKAKKLIQDENFHSVYLFDTITDQKNNELLKKIAEGAGINKTITSHTARHTFATIFLSKTDDVATLQKLLGHSNISETMKYTHISSKKIDVQMKNFEALLNLENKKAAEITHSVQNVKSPVN